MSSVIIDLQYLPSLEYFVCLLKHENVFLEINEFYEKQSYRNRCYIRGANGIQTLTIPVKNGNSKVLMKDVEIDYNQKWVNEHWRSINSAYGKAPYFEFFGIYFEKLYAQKPRLLLDFNQQLLTLCLKLMKWDKKLTSTENYQPIQPEGFLDLRSVVHPKTHWQNNSIYKAHAYNQVFGKDFESNLSIIDLLFCEGPNAKNILAQSMA